ncbi:MULTISPECIES: hypothetical protein [Actinomyces]|uniref:Uncharacterized protein n=1 Tax=Actinomyces respiraculi TaxID=2744574 RepID=A0A7T0LJ36_9ACTO|nr:MULTISPECIES: hypothetical protein [Actinomyces]QPL04572.1 hypothetical protein ID810_07110 [Actinomyces respiraculi]
MSVDVTSMTAEDVPADGTASANGLIVMSYETGALPLDPYVQPDVRLQGYAHDVAMALCMKTEGYHYPVIEFDWNSPDATPSTRYRRARTPEEAQLYGYRLSPSDGDPRVREAGDYISSQPAAYQTQLGACADSVSEMDMFSTVVVGTNAEIAGIEENRPLRDAMQQWRDCMMPLGIPDLPEDHPGLAPSLASTWELNLPDSNALIDLTSLTSEEVTIAVQDAQCNASSGYDRLRYGLYWAAEDQILAENGPEYAARREQIAAQEQVFKDYILEHRDEL